MNLHQLIEQYVAFRQALGDCFQCRAGILRAFARTVGGQVDANEVRADQVSAFLAATGPLTRTWHEKYSAVLGLYRYANTRGYAHTTPLPGVVPKRPAPFVPYIYSQQDLRRLLDAIPTCLDHPHNSLEPLTMRTVLLLLYGAGLRVGEAIRLDRPDVDLTSAVLTIRRTKFYKSRLVPVGTQLVGVLTQYLQQPRPGWSGEPGPTAFFTTRSGERVKKDPLQAAFRRLRRAGIVRTDAARQQPRLHDLRHSFAVARLTSWYRQGADVQKLLPQLSVYLGHANLAATQVYLSMTTELLAQANARFERYAAGEDNHD